MTDRPLPPRRDLKYMSIEEFRRLGYLQEVNRQLLHPLGLALEVRVLEDGSMQLSGVWDCREDPEGVIYGDVGIPRPEKAAFVADELERRSDRRAAALGYVIQPCGRPPDAPMPGLDQSIVPGRRVGPGETDHEGAAEYQRRAEERRRSYESRPPRPAGPRGDPL